MLTRKTRAHDHAGAATGLLAIAAAVLLTSCGPAEIRGEAPFAQVTSWRLDGDEVAVDLRLRNVNDVTLAIEELNLTVWIDEVELFSYSEPRQTNVIPHSFEILSLKTPVSDAGAKLLEQLRARDLASVPYALIGSIRNPDHGLMHFDRDGHLYNVPGRPGHFR